jgi:hypothetical protein
MYRPCSANKGAITQEVNVRVILVVKISSLQDGQYDLDWDASRGNEWSWKIVIKFVRRGTWREFD